MEVLSLHDQSTDDWHSSVDESWDSRLSTPLALNFSSMSDADGLPDLHPSLHDSYIDAPSVPYSPPQLSQSNGYIETDTEYLQMARKGGGHSDLLTVEPHVPTPEPVTYNKTDGQWYTHEGVDIKDTQQRKEMPATVNGSTQNGDGIIAAGGNNREYLDLAKKGGGHKDLLTVEPHVPTPEPVRYDKTDGQWYSHDGVDIEDTQQRKEMFTTLDRSSQGIDSAPAAGCNNREYLELAKKGGGHEGLLKVEPHVASPELVTYDKKDGQWYTHEGVDAKESLQRKEMSTILDSSIHEIDSVAAAGGNNREYLELAKKGGGHQDLLTVEPHVPTPEPVTYDKMDGQWYTHEGVDVKDTQQRKEMFTSVNKPYTDMDSVAAAGGNSREYLELAKKGGGHKDLLTVEPHVPTPEPVTYDKTDGQWYTHEGVDVKDTQKRKEMSTILDSSIQEIDSVTAAGCNNREYLEMAKKGGGHEDLLKVEPHVASPEPVIYGKKDGQWYAHEGVDVKDTQQRKEMFTTKDRSSQNTDNVAAAGGNNREYLELAKKGGGHKDLLTVEPHVPTPEPVTYDKMDGQWYTHEGVDVKDMLQRKEMSTILDSSVEEINITMAAGGNSREYLELARKGGGHKDLLTIEAHSPTTEPITFDKKDGQWYTHEGVDVKDTQQRKEMFTNVTKPEQDVDSIAAAGGNNREYLELAKKGGGHRDLLTKEDHSPTPEPVLYDRKDGQWYTHDRVDAKASLQRKEMSTILDSSVHEIDSAVAAGGDNREYLALAKKGGGRKDLLTKEDHSPTPEAVTYVRKDGKWYTHDGVDAKDTLQRKEMSTILDSSVEEINSTIAAGGNNREYLELAKKGGGHKDLLTVEPHVPTPEPVTYDKKDGQWYAHHGVDVKETQQRKELNSTFDGSFEETAGMVAAGGKATEYLDLAKKGGGHKDLLIIDPHTPTATPLKYEKRGGDWYNQDDMETIYALEEARALRKRRRTYSDSEVKAETEYLQTARKGGGHKDLLTIEPHTPSAEPLKYERKDGAWYTHDGVDVKDTQERKEMVTVSNSPRQSSPDISLDVETETDYLKIAKKGGGHKDLLAIESHTPTTEPVTYDKTDGQWYTYDGVDARDTLQRKQLSTVLDSSIEEIEGVVAAGGNNREYLELAKKGGGHKDLLTIEAHSPTPEPVTYDKKDGQWYTHEGVDVKDTQQRKEMVTVASSPRQSSANTSLEISTDTDYLKIAKKGGGHKDLLAKEDHSPTSEPVTYDRKDGQWYTHEGVEIKDTLQRKEMSTILDSSIQEIDSVTAAGCNNREYLEMAKKGGGHEDLLTVKPHVPTPEPVTYDKTEGQWYAHEGIDVKDTQQRKEMFTNVERKHQDLDSVTAAGGNNREYLELAKKGGGHKDLLTVEPHVPTPEPVTYDKTDGQWYTHEGVDVKDTQQRKEMVTVSDSPRRSSADTSLDISTDTDYLKIAKKGGGHKDLLTVEPHVPTTEPVTYDKKDGQWYTHEGVDVKDTQQRKDLTPRSPTEQDMNSISPAGCNNREYLELAKKGGGHKDLLEILPHTPTSKPVTYDRTDGQWYTHEGVDVKETQQRKDISMTVESARKSSEDMPAAGENHGHYLEMAKKGGHKDILTKEDHSPTPEPVTYDKKDGQWYTHEGVDVKDTQQRKEMITVSDRPQQSSPDTSLDVSVDTDYLKIAKKGGGHKDLLIIESHTPSPEAKKYDKKDGQWYTHEGVDVKDTQLRKEMVTVPERPRKSAANTSLDVETETDYIKIAKKGGGHKDLLMIEPHTPTHEPVKYDKKDGQWYVHEGVDVKESQQKKEMPTIPSSPRHPRADTSVDIDTNTDYLAMARKGGGHKDLLTVQPHTPSTTPVKYERKGGDWYNQDDMETLYSPRDTSTPRKPRRTHSDSEMKGETEYLRTARKGGGHKDLLTMEPQTPSPEPKRYEKIGGDWHSQTDGSPSKTPSSASRTTGQHQTSGSPESVYERLARKGGAQRDGQSPRTPRRTPSDSKIELKTETEYLRTARKGGGHKDLLTIEPHTPSPEPRKYERKGGEWYNQDSTDGKKVQPKDANSSASPHQQVQVNTETEYLRTARKGGSRKDLLSMEPQTLSPKPNKQKGTSGDGHYHDSSTGKENGQRKDSPNTSSPRNTSSTSSPAQNDTEYIRMARKGGGHKDLLAMTPHKPSPQPKEVKRNGAPPSVISPPFSSKEPVNYHKGSRRSGGQPERGTVDASQTSASGASPQASLSEYLNLARKGGHHKDLLTMPDNNNGPFTKIQETPKTSRSRTPGPQLSWSVQVDGTPRPKSAADYRQPHPIWLGGSGPERVHSPGKRFINQSYGSAPYASHDGSPGAAKNPDKI